MRPLNRVTAVALTWACVAMCEVSLIAQSQNAGATAEGAASRGTTTNRVSTAAGGAADVEAREVKPRDVLHYRIDEDPVEGRDPIQVEVTDLYKAVFKVSRGTDKAITLDVKGKKLAEIRSEVRSKLEEDYYHKATVSIELAQTGGRAGANSTGAKVIFQGEARGFVPLVDGEKLMLSEALLRVGYSDWADLTKIRVIRKDSEGKVLAPIKLDMKKVIKDGKLDQDFELMDGDRIDVPQKWVRFGNN